MAFLPKPKNKPPGGGSGHNRVAPASPRASPRPSPRPSPRAGAAGGLRNPANDPSRLVVGPSPRGVGGLGRRRSPRPSAEQQAKNRGVAHLMSPRQQQMRNNSKSSSKSNESIEPRRTRSPRPPEEIKYVSSYSDSSLEQPEHRINAGEGSAGKEKSALAKCVEKLPCFRAINACCYCYGKYISGYKWCSCFFDTIPGKVFCAVCFVGLAVGFGFMIAAFLNLFDRGD
ncbi:unnamed protein product [Amoebophrya sp. A120]|nr:unnamed protein product [Amoebophrya sp. A120]|eukprot:GSA120T00016901001.1